RADPCLVPRCLGEGQGRRKGRDLSGLPTGLDLGEGTKAASGTRTMTSDGRSPLSGRSDPVPSLQGAGADLAAVFLGPKGENADAFERLLLDAFRDHVFWRRNFHPEDGFLLDEI